MRDKIHSTVREDLFPLLKLAIPLVFTGAIASSIFFFETLFLAHIDQKTVAAGALVSWLYGVLATVIFGTMGAMNVLISHKHGANDHEGISRVVRDGFLLSVLLVIPAFILFWNMGSIFILLGQHEDIVLLAKSYLHALTWGLMANFILVAILELIIGLGHVRVVMIYSIIEAFLNIFFSYVFIFGKWGFPKLGIAGAGWGTTVGFWLSVVILFLYVITNKKYKPYFKNWFVLGKPFLVGELLQIGLPMGVMYCIEVAFFFAIALMMGTFGSQVLAANQIVSQYEGMFTSAIFAIAQAITVRMSYLFGSEKFILAKRAGYCGIGIAVSFMFIVGIIYWSIPTKLIALDFNVHDKNNFSLIKDIERFFMIAAFFQIAESARIALFGALRALRDTRFTMAVSLVSFWGIAFPLGYYLAKYIFHNGIGLWVGMTISAGLSVIALGMRFKHQLLKQTQAT